MTVKANKPGAVTLACEGITVPGAMCDGSVVVKIPNKGEDGRPFTKTKRVTVARKQIQVKGWSVTKGADACPRVHSMVPVPVKAKNRVDEGAPPCNHDQRAGIVTNQPETYDKARPHVSVTVCGDPACRAASLGYVLAQTGEHATYISDRAAA